MKVYPLWFLPCFVFFLQVFFRPVFAWKEETTPRLHIVGSTALYSFSTAVAEHFGAQKNHPTPIVEANGTGGGFRIFCQSGLNGPDAVNASRPIEELERAYCLDRGVSDLKVFKVSEDAVVIGVHQSSPLRELSLEHLFKALSKEIYLDGQWVANPYHFWSDIDSRLPHQKIGVLGPPPSSGTYSVIVEGVLKPFCLVPQKCLQIRRDGLYLPLSEQENVIIQKLILNPHKLGIFSFAFLQFQREKIRPLILEGFLPTVEAIQGEKYPLFRELFIYTTAQKLEEKPELKEFIDQFYTEKAVGDRGYLTLKGFIRSVR